MQLPDGHVAAFRPEGTGYRDTIGSGRYRLHREALTGRWLVTDCHDHMTYGYNEQGLLETAADRNGQKLSLTYQGEYPEKLATAPGYTVEFTFHDGKLAGMSDDSGRSYQYHYEGGLLTEVVHMDGGVERFFYDAAGNRTRHVLPEQYDSGTDDGPG